MRIDQVAPSAKDSTATASITGGPSRPTVSVSTRSCIGRSDIGSATGAASVLPASPIRRRAVRVCGVARQAFHTAISRVSSETTLPSESAVGVRWMRSK